MPRVARMYVPLSTSFFMDDDVLNVGESAGWLYLRMLAQAKALESDGVLTERQVLALNVPDVRKRLADLLAVGLIIADGDVFTIRGFLKWNESKAARDARREADRKRKHTA